LCSRAMSVGAALVSRFHATPSSHAPRAYGDIRWAVPEGRVPRGSHRRVPWLDTLFAVCAAMQQRRTRTGSGIVGSCCRSRDLPGASSRVESNRTRYSRSYGAQADPSKFPKCPQGCSSIARPNILMFNDSDWTRTRTAAQSDRLVDWYSSLVATQTPCVVIEVGAGTSVPTVRYQSELLSRVPGSYIVRINAREPQIPHNRKGFELPMSALVRECQCVSRE